MSMKDFKQGYYEVKNPDKYMGDPAKCRYLSSYELHFMEWADRSSAVLEWGAEVVTVRYKHPYKLSKDNKKPFIARYMVDIYVKYRDANGVERIELIEIKPKAQCIKPKKGNKKESTYIDQMLTWEVNNAKWEAATKFAEERGWEFKVLTEDALFF